MSELVDNHPLARDLPEFKDAIRTLKGNDRHFARLLTHYEALDKEVVRLEQGVELASDQEIDALKLKRVQLKDELYGLLRAS